MNNWYIYQTQWQPGMPIIGYPTGSQEGDCIRQNLSYLVCNAPVYKSYEAGHLYSLRVQKLQQMLGYALLNEHKNDEDFQINIDSLNLIR